MKKAVSLAIAILIVMATIAVPVATAETGTLSTTQSTCTTCGAQTANCGTSNVTVVKLSGEESNKAISNALGNEQVKNLRKELINEGYTPKINDAETAYRVTTINGSVVSEILSVVIHFNSHDIGGNATISYNEKVDKTTVEAIIQEDNVITVFRDGYRYQTGPASVLSEPLTILRINSTYVDVKANLTQGGAIIREDLASVVINQSSGTASILIPIENGTGYMVADIDLMNQKVISIVDPSYWDCVYSCMPDWLKGVCTMSCMNCVIQLSIPWCIACGACGCGAGWCVGHCVPSSWKPVLCPAVWLACLAGDAGACCVNSGCDA